MLLKSVFDFELVFLNKQNWAILILTLGLVALQSTDDLVTSAKVRFPPLMVKDAVVQRMTASAH